MPNLAAVKSRVYGLENAIAERAVILLDKLSRSTIHPYSMFGSKTGLTQNAQTDLPVENFRNDQDGPLVITKLRAYTTAAINASTVGALFSNVSLQAYDLDGQHSLMKNPSLLPTLFAIDNNTLTLDRPYVLHRRSALLFQATEENVVGTTDLYLSVLGETVLGDMTGAEVEEAIALGIYPLPGRQSSLWDHVLVFGGLFGDRPPRLKGYADDCLHRLRIYVATLREKLRSAEYVTYSLEANQDNITQGADTAMGRKRFQNDQNGAFAINKIRIFTTTALAASAATALVDNVSLTVESIDERIQLTRSMTLGATLFSPETNTWTFEHPHVVGQNGALQVVLREENVNGTTDVYVTMVGEAVRGVSRKELRMAVALGLYPLMERG